MEFLYQNCAHNKLTDLGGLVIKLPPQLPHLLADCIFNCANSMAKVYAPSFSIYVEFQICSRGDFSSTHLGNAHVWTKPLLAMTATYMALDWSLSRWAIDGVMRRYLGRTQPCE